MYFTVNTPIKIEGKPFRPCICYEIQSSAMELTVDGLVKEGKAELHDKFVFFCNGKPVAEKAQKFDLVEKPAKKTKAKAKKAEQPEPVEYEAKEEDKSLEPLEPVDENTEDF